MYGQAPQRRWIEQIGRTRFGLLRRIRTSFPFAKRPFFSVTVISTSSPHKAPGTKTGIRSIYPMPSPLIPIFFIVTFIPFSLPSHMEQLQQLTDLPVFRATALHILRVFDHHMNAKTKIYNTGNYVD